MLTTKLGPIDCGATGPEGVEKSWNAPVLPSPKQNGKRGRRNPHTNGQQVGAAARGLLDKLEAQRERMRLIEQLIAWHHDLSQRVAHAQHHFMTRDCSQDHRDLLLEFEHFKLALALAKKGRRQ
jgi:hypothetical protein